MGGFPRIISASDGRVRLVDAQVFHGSHVAMAAQKSLNFGIGKASLGDESLAAWCFQLLGLGRVNSLDMEKFDAHEIAMLIALCMYIERACYYGFSDPALFEMIVQSEVLRVEVLPSGASFLVFGKRPTGSYHTSSGNTILKQLSTLYCLARISSEVGVRLSSLRRRGFTTRMGAFPVTFGTHGDDELIAVPEALASYITFERMSACYAELGLVCRFFMTSPPETSLPWCSHHPVRIGSKIFPYRDPNETIGKMSVVSMDWHHRRMTNAEIRLVLERWAGQVVANPVSLAVWQVYCALYAKFRPLGSRFRLRLSYDRHCYVDSIDPESLNSLIGVSKDMARVDDVALVQDLPYLLAYISTFSYNKVLPVVRSVDTIATVTRRLPRVCLITASTGAGKSTRFVQELTRFGRVLVAVPRIKLAKGLAHFTGAGYAVKGETKQHGNVLYATYGRASRLWADFDVVILDECHEASLLGWRSLLNAAANGQRAYAMSATLPDVPLQWPTIVLPGTKSHSITDVHHLEEPTVASVGRAFLRHVSSESRVLIFAHSRSSVYHWISKVKQWTSARIFPLYSGLPSEDLASALSFTGPAVYVATTIAEAGITIPDLDVVMDMGYTLRPMFYASNYGLAVKRRRVTYAERHQRRGRTGRTTNGFFLSWGPVLSMVKRVYPSGFLDDLSALVGAPDWLFYEADVVVREFYKRHRKSLEKTGGRPQFVAELLTDATASQIRKALDEHLEGAIEDVDVKWPGTRLFYPIHPRFVGVLTGNSETGLRA
jgi:hypothetical protein